MLENLSAVDIFLAGTFVSSGLSKVLAPQGLKEMWPRLPSWFWPICGMWEATGGLLITNILPDSLKIGFPLMYSFMGGVCCSILVIKNNEGNTIISGKSSLGGMGFVPLIFASAVIYIIWSIDEHHSNLVMPVVYGIFGAVWGLICSHLGYDDAKKQKGM
mmetsp:Transcript_5835/g.7358  ORF Transcript_5835/g.7358 Transcript_5835/m.7358 type:complete len:160 (-) Transcript_5835:276-755(-)|eukprot:CAMPEP_0172497324 /NCGR_PEP_ID=MMETSP1066-20121228/98272_1 /TAXON_ID=671091 /ORGANISM="Coscinodiscus wailesii, Strain CCMP2513" /LENGTH=159 /DNA_ID=CAMNT_0013270021 /DNA_START=83 /DNA_END=562 /DNA_ORIENTATION=+